MASSLRGLSDSYAPMKQTYRFRVVIADDNEAMRKEIADRLDSLVDVVASVGDGRSALVAIESHGPDLVVLDICMPEMGGIEVARELTRQNNPAKIIFVSLHGSPALMEAAEAAGGVAYLLKTSLNQHLLETVRSLLPRQADS